MKLEITKLDAEKCPLCGSTELVVTQSFMNGVQWILAACSGHLLYPILKLTAKCQQCGAVVKSRFR